MKARGRGLNIIRQRSGVEVHGSCDPPSRHRTSLGTAGRVCLGIKYAYNTLDLPRAFHMFPWPIPQTSWRSFSVVFYLVILANDDILCVEDLWDILFTHIISRVQRILRESVKTEAFISSLLNFQCENLPAHEQIHSCMKFPSNSLKPQMIQDLISKSRKPSSNLLRKKKSFYFPLNLRILTGDSPEVCRFARSFNHVISSLC